MRVTMVDRLALRANPIAARAAEYAPVVPACCNVCRTCTTTNVVGLVLGGATAAVVGAARFARRLARR